MAGAAFAEFALARGGVARFLEEAAAAVERIEGFLERALRDEPGEVDAALTVPLSAVLADERGERVQVVRNGVVETRPVRAGLVWQDRREILEGLEAGEQVIARAGAFFRTGDPVRAAPGSQP